MNWIVKLHMIFFLLPVLEEEECLKTKNTKVVISLVSKGPKKHEKLQLKTQVTSIFEFHLNLKAVANIVGLLLRIVEICHFTDQGHINRVCVEQSLCNKFCGSSHLAVFWNLIWNVCWVRRRLVLTILQGTWGRNGDMTIAFACDTKGSKGQRDCRKNHSQLSNFMICKQLGPLCGLMWSYIRSTLLPFIQKFRDVIFVGGYLLGLNYKGGYENNPVFWKYSWVLEFIFSTGGYQQKILKS